MEQLSLKDWLIRLFFVFLFIFMINRLFFFSPGVAEITTSYVLYPIIKIQKIVTDPISAYFFQKHDKALLRHDINVLESENENLKAKVIKLESVLDFTMRSQDIRDFEYKYDFSKKKIVQVLMRSFDDLGHFYWVDGGSNHGIVVNMIAVYKNNIVGRVVHVDSSYSKIILLTDKRCKIAARCAQTKTVGIYEGSNNFLGKLEFVPHYELLEQDDLLISTGQGLVYPQGFAIGKIKHFEVQDVAYKVFVEPLIDLQKIEFVHLVLM